MLEIFKLSKEEDVIARSDGHAILTVDLHLDVDDFIDTVLLECFVRSSQFVVDVVSVLFLRNRRKFNAIVMPVFAAWIEPVLP